MKQSNQKRIESSINRKLSSTSQMSPPCAVPAENLAVNVLAGRALSQITAVDRAVEIDLSISRVILRKGEGGGYNCTKKKAHNCVRRPATDALRMFSPETGAKQYEWTLFVYNKLVRTTHAAFD